MTKPVDAQRAKAYASEFALRDVLDFADQVENRVYDFYGSKIVLPIERKFASLESIETYCNMVLQLEPVMERWPHVGAVKVRERRGDNFAHYERFPRPTIAIHTGGSRWALREIVVLHELAHHLEFGDGHGKKWQTAFTGLLTLCIGPEIGMILGAYFHQNMTGLQDK